jgi:hypothetical protein
MGTSGPQDDVSELSPDDEPEVPTFGLKNYASVPWYRRNGLCSAIVGTHAAVMVLGACVPFVILLGVFTTPAVIAVCALVLTGPIYYNERIADGTLRTWSRGNKVAAVILLLLFVGGYAALLFYAAVARHRFG